jgi:hypothetical protein
LWDAVKAPFVTVKPDQTWRKILRRVANPLPACYDLALSFFLPFDFLHEKVTAKVKMGWIHTDYSVEASDMAFLAEQYGTKIDRARFKALVGEAAVGGKRVHALHVHDVDYINDCHTLPGAQKLDFDAVAKALADIDYDGELTLEADNFLRGFGVEFFPQAAKFMADRARFIADKVDAYRAK